MKTIISILLLVGTIVVLTVVTQYLFCPVYSFPSPVPFSGDSIYNPYSSITKDGWVKCNFHAHAHCWNGITKGNATAEDIHRVYDRWNYGIAAVSNYQLIDTTGHTKSNYISAYEHGCNVMKNHQLVLGAKNVCWKDYYLPETVSNKQDILNALAAYDTNSLCIINHPMVRGGYSASDFSRLTYYSCMEVLNPACNSSAFWDAALTAGKPVFIVGDDDTHDVMNAEKIAKICTWINVPEVNEKAVIHALKIGSSYAMTIGELMKQQVRRGNSSSLPCLRNISVAGNRVQAKFNLPAQNIQVIGTNGKILLSSYHSDSVSYDLSKTDCYARITADYGNRTVLYLNPVFRYQQHPLKQSVAAISTNLTLLLRTAGTILLLFWFNIVMKALIPQKFENRWQNLLTKSKKRRRSGKVYRQGIAVWYRKLSGFVYKSIVSRNMQRKNRFE